jgi:prepilin peptidase CpaA
MTIANRVSVMLVVGFAAIAPLTGMPWAVYGFHLLAGVLMLTVTFGLFAVGAMGGGDAKLIAATSIWMGYGTDLVQYLVVSSFLGGALTLLIIVFRASPVAVLAGRFEFLRRIGDAKTGIPYGIALGLGGLVVFPQSALGQWVVDRLVAL